MRKPPQAEIDAARAALDAASRSEDIVTYAPDALRRAQEKMNALEAELALQARRSAFSRRFDAAASLAQETAALATQAGTQAAADKQQVAADAAALIDEVSAAIPRSNPRCGLPGAFRASRWTSSRLSSRYPTRRGTLSMMRARTSLPAPSRRPGASHGGKGSALVQRRDDHRADEDCAEPVDGAKRDRKARIRTRRCSQ